MATAAEVTIDETAHRALAAIVAPLNAEATPMI
jgi:hypothetical protein